MESPYKKILEAATNKRLRDLNNARINAVNVMEHDGELWICSFGEPIVPMSLTKCDPANPSEFMETCRNGWVNYKERRANV